MSALGCATAAALLAKLAESPFYRREAARSQTPARSRGKGARREVSDVFRVGDDQAVELEVRRSDPEQGTR